MGRRAAIAEIRERMDRAKRKSLSGDVLSGKLVKFVEEYVKDLTSKDYCDDNDWDQMCMETVVQAVLGDDIYSHINQLL